MNGRFGELLVGWVFVFCAAVLVVAQIGRAVGGHSATPYEWPAVLGIAALLLLIGLANLVAERSRWLTVAVLGGFALFCFGVGVPALISPDAMTVTSGIGPRTAGGARVAGVVMVVVGSVMLVGAWRSSRGKLSSGRET